MPQPDTPTMLQVRQLSFSHPGHRVLHDLSFDVRPGLTLVLGGDGRGKTTLLRLLAGSLQPTSGTVACQAPATWFEHPADPAHDAVVARAWLDAAAARHPAWAASQAAALVDAFGLAPHLDKPLHQLSTGSRRKVGLVGAAASGAALTLLDQPSAALDAASLRVLDRLLVEAATQRARAWVVTSFEAPAGLDGVPLSATVALGD